MSIREYPMLYTDSIMDTYRAFRFENPEESPKESWELAEHIHRSHPQFLIKVEKYDRMIPYQYDDIYV